MKLGVRTWAGTAEDQFIQLTEGVVACRDARRPGRRARATSSVERLGPHHDGRDARSRPPEGVHRDRARASPGHPRAALRRARRAPRAARRPGRPHAAAGRRPRLHRARTARRTCSSIGGIPQGDYAPVPWVLGSRGWAAWIETDGPRRALRPRRRGRALGPRARPGRCGCTSSRTRRRPPGCARSCALTGLPPVLPEWAYGHWKSRDVYAHQRDAEADHDGYREHDDPARRDRARLALGDAIQHLGVQPAPVPGRRGDDRAAAATDGVRTVVWVAPWVNLDSTRRAVSRPTPSRSGCTATPAPNYEPRRCSSATATASRSSRAGGWGPGSPVDFTSPVAEEWWREQAKRVLAARRRRDQGRRRRGLVPARRRAFADGTTGAQAAWGHGLRYRRSMQRALDEVHPGDGRAVRAPGLDRPAGGRDHLGRRPAVGLLVAADAGRRDADRGRQRLLATGRTTSAATSASGSSRAARRSCSLRWVAVRLLHAADAGARALRAGGVDLRRGDARGLPRARPAARAARARTCAPRRRPRRAAGCRSCGRWR